MEIKSYFEHLEWEYLQNKFQIDEIALNPNLPPNIERIEVWRDKSYKIKARVFAIEKRDSKKDYLKSPTLGKSIKPFTINGNIKHGSSDVELRNCYIEQYKANVDENDTYQVELDLLIGQMKVIFSNDSEVARLTDWYLNAPQDLYLPRLTERHISFNLKKSRESIEEANLNYSNKLMGFGRDFAYVDTNEVKFILAKVNNDFGPKWSNNIGIEYIKQLGSIPDAETRESISEIVSFTIGKQLLPVGYTKYNSDERIVEIFVKSPWTNNTMSFCQEPDYKPINLGIRSHMKLENVLKQLVPSYLQLRKESNLNETLYLYWASIDSLIWVSLPIISAALEGLIQKYIKSNKFKFKSVYMEKKDFDELLHEEMTTISEKLDTKEFDGKTEYRDKILNRIHNSYHMSASDRFPYFFDYINLKIGEIENKAINARHGVAHGGSKFDSESIEKSISMRDAYLTLFNRVFLKILGYNGYYIDMSTEGFPERHIDVQLGGNKK